MTTTGIHHITAISSNAQQTVDFYAGILGLRLVKKSVNQDDVSTYHLFFGNREGSPGMDLTFFPFQPARQGVSGAGSVSQISFAIPANSIEFWKQRLQQYRVDFQVHQSKEHHAIKFTDSDGLELELIEVKPEQIPDHYRSTAWTTPNISATSAIHAFYSATLSVGRLESISEVLELLGFTRQEADKSVWQIPQHTLAHQLNIDARSDHPQHVSGAGTVHHIAFGVTHESDLIAYRQILLKYGLRPTQVIDRYYFQSVYFQTPAGILFELATHQPGFAVDEDVSSLGQSLALPPFLETYRSEIEAQLPELHMPK